jgi:putative iron-dependent peroxidase
VQATATSAARRQRPGLISLGYGLPKGAISEEIGVALPQTGIFALGNLSHSYLEFDLLAGVEPAALVTAVASLTEPRTTMGGVNLVTAFRPELWSAVAPSSAPAEVTGFASPVVAAGGYAMPATQHDLALWIAGGAYDVVFDAAIGMIAALSQTVALVDETVGWSYHRDLDLTGFIDGTKNQPLSVAPKTVLVPAGAPGAGGSVLLLQKWVHDGAAWTSLDVKRQEQVIGRTKVDSVELVDRPETSHVARTDQDDFGQIFRRNTAFGSVREHGTMFVGFSAEQRYLAVMLESMAGLTNGVRDELTLYSRPVTGAYYFVPSLDDLDAFASTSIP